MRAIRRSRFCSTVVLLFFSLLLFYHIKAMLLPQVFSLHLGPLVKHLASLLKWTARSSSKTPHLDGNVLQFEDGYLVETVVEGNEIGVVPYQIRVSTDGELFAVDEVNGNIVKITPPLSQYSRARLVAGSFQGYKGHVDGKASEARFNHPKGVTMDDKGNLYVADTLNHAIRKIGDSGVTTIAGGKSNAAGYRDGPSEDAKFSNDFDVIYVQPSCSLLIVDRGNAALRQITLNQEDCDYRSSSVSLADVFMVLGAVFAGYCVSMLQQGFGLPFFSRNQQFSDTEFIEQSKMEKPTLIVESMKEEPGWPSFGQLMIDLSKLALEALANVFFYLVPSKLKLTRPRKGLTPLKNSLRMPEDEVEPPLTQKQSTPPPQSEMRQVHTPITNDKYSEIKPPKTKLASFKDSSLSSKHRSSKKQEQAEFYGSGEVPPYNRSKSNKERTRHRHRDKSGEVASVPTGTEPKPVEMKPVGYNYSKFDHYNMRSKCGLEDTYRL
ncbi:hypothetical protein K2173_004616 [Erythroxylum novogranatense]|uniref:NHL repeat-containing protein n=1 Tax=Erythroxylum novogranatense TaxID=1862640 RepID=A0AAV8UBF4_9ROSI|nr:hypothetical protein K2173_004616 [Erythroxylum novogranatense]